MPLPANALDTTSIVKCPPPPFTIACAPGIAVSMACRRASTTEPWKFVGCDDMRPQNPVSAGQSILRHAAVDRLRPSVDATAHVVDVAEPLAQHLLRGVLAAHPVVTQKCDGRVAVERKQILLPSLVERPSLGNAR